MVVSTVPTWVTSLDDAVLARRLNRSALQRGRAYAKQGAVAGITVSDDGEQLTASVRGASRYSTTVTRRVPTFDGRCTCPVRVDCKHVAALLLTARALVPAGPPLPAWEARLAPLVGVGSAEPDGVALALQVGVVPPARGTAARVRLRPVRAGAGEKWVKAGASWRDLDHGYGSVRLRPDHRRALAAVWAAARALQPAWMPLYADSALHLDELDPSAWRGLAAAQRAGVVLLDEQGRATVRLAPEPVSVVADLRADGDDLLLQAQLQVPAATGRAVLVGSPPCGLWSEDADGLLLAALAEPLDPASVQLLKAPLRVPGPDLPRFYRRYYPALRQRLPVTSSDGSVTPPDVVLPRLHLAVTFAADHVTELTWTFHYDDVAVPLVGPCDDVVRDADAETALLAALAGLPDVPGVWEAGGRPRATTRLHGIETARFAGALLPALLELSTLDVAVEGEPADYVETSAPPLITVATSDSDTGSDWFDLAVDVSVDGQQVPLAQLISALASGDEHLVLASGTWFALDRPELQTLRRLVEEARSLQDRERPGLRLSVLQAGLWEELVELGVVGQQSERWARTVGGLLDLQELPRPDPPAGLAATLRPYQLEGYHWLSLLWDLGLGGVLADDMGLGKTVQTLALAERAREQGSVGGEAGPLLVVAPTSVVGTWAAEAARFCPGLSVVAVTETERRSGRPLAERTAGADVVVTSYALLRLDDDAYLGQRWAGLVLDEAQHVKNPRAKTYGVVRRVSAPVTFAITGTPLENSLMDLWALLSITAPGLFPDPQAFSETWRKPIEAGSAPELLEALRRRVRPLMLRRTKEQVAADLPDKVEQVLEVPLGPAHRRLYDQHLQRERQRVLGLLDDLQKNRFAVFKSLTLLRQLSLDPALVDSRHADVGSAKIDALVELLAEVAGEGHRALVFSSFTGFLGRVRSRLEAERIGHCYLDGRTRDRPARIEQFRSGTDPVFLISLKAGGTGLTLTEADYVFVLDPWWNPAVEAQAVDRAHRIGQTRTVMVYRLVSADTVEQKVVALQQRKRDLFASVVDGEGAASSVLTADDIRALLG